MVLLFGLRQQVCRHVTQTDVILEAHHLVDPQQAPIYLSKSRPEVFIQLSICGGLLSK